MAAKSLSVTVRKNNFGGQMATKIHRILAKAQWWEFDKMMAVQLWRTMCYQILNSAWQWVVA